MPVSYSCLACLLVYLHSGVQHEFYVGITEITYNAKARTYEVAIKLFTDDLELAIDENSGINPHLGTGKEHASADSLVFAYALRLLDVGTSKQQLLRLNEVGRETDLDVTWIYFETGASQPLAEVFVRNEMLMELFRDQTHIVKLIQGGETGTRLLHHGERTATIKP